MNSKIKIGISLMVLAIVLFTVVIVMVQSNLASSGPWSGKITTYKPPFETHGLLTVLIGIGAAVSFLSGAVMTVLGKSKK